MTSKPKKFVTCGFTLIEMLISMAIIAMLLTAIAVVLNASTINYRQNESIYRTVNMARQALLRMTSQIRTGYVDSNDLANESICEISCADGSFVRYHYDSVNDKLYIYDYTTAADYLLCDNVTAMSFKKNNSTPTGDIKSVRISLTVENSDIRQKLAAAAVVRKILEH